jgi:hypothetical protein
MAERRRDVVVMSIVELGRHEQCEHDSDDGPQQRGAEVRDRSDIAHEEIDEAGDDEAGNGTGDRADGRRDTAANLACGRFLRRVRDRWHVSLVPARPPEKPRRARQALMFQWRGGVARCGMASSRDEVLCEVFTYVVVLQAGDGRATLPITVCARPDEAEHAARVIAYLELVVLGLRADDGL